MLYNIYIYKCILEAQEANKESHTTLREKRAEMSRHTS